MAAKKPVKKVAKTSSKPAARKVAKPASKARPAAKSVKKRVHPAAKKPSAKKPAPKKTAATKPVKKPAAKKAPAKKVLAKKPAPAKPVVAKKAAPAKPAPVAKPVATVATKAPALAQHAVPAKKGKASAPVAPPKPTPPAPAPVVRPQGARAKAVVRNNLPEKVIPIQAVQTGVKLPKGYKPTSKEPYMSAFQMEYFRQRLLAWRADLVEESKQTIENLKEEVRDVGDEAERATRETENSLELRTRDRYRKLIGKIDDALKRIDDGIYGYCVDTGDEIGLERLEARLTAERTIDAQERWEHRQKQMGD